MKATDNSVNKNAHAIDPLECKHHVTKLKSCISKEREQKKDDSTTTKQIEQNASLIPAENVGHSVDRRTRECSVGREKKRKTRQADESCN